MSVLNNVSIWATAHLPSPPPPLPLPYWPNVDPDLISVDCCWVSCSDNEIDTFQVIQPSTFEWAFFEGNAANTLRLSSSQKSNASPELRLSLILRRQFPGKSNIKLQYSLFLIKGFCICGVIIQAWWMYFSLKFYDKTVSATVGGSFKPKFV